MRKEKDKGKMEKRRGIKRAVILIFVFLAGIMLFSVSKYLLKELSEHSMYKNSYENVESIYFNEVLDQYSVYALSNYNNDFAMDYFKETNFRYGVIKTEKFDELNLNNKSNYIVNNFDDNFDAEKCHVYSATINEKTNFAYDLTAFGVAYINNSFYYTWNEYNITNYLFNWMDGKIYCQIYIDGEKKLYPVESDIIINNYNGNKVDNTMLNDDKNAWINPDSELWLDAIGFNSTYSKIKIVDDESIRDYGTVDTESEFYFRQGKVAVAADEIKKEDSYYVISYVNEPLENNNDIFTQVRNTLKNMYSYRFWPVAGIIAALLMIVVSSVWLFIIWLRFAIEKWHNDVSLLARGILVFIAVNFVELMLIFAIGSMESVIAFWIIGKLIIYPLGLTYILQLKKVKECVEHLSAGDYSYRADTKDMYFDFRKICERLNEVRTGMENAVNERMKSEHFKTELITNVSHDIKTPLTSIISYVDLLKKEEAGSDTSKEYLDVLENQSVKLKKLIEDLIEASKATTGNLKAEMVPCNVNVALTQTIGEYEEKLADKNITLVIDMPEEPVEVLADARHMQRVFDNLMVNVNKHGQPFTRCYINLEQQNNSAVVTFKNISGAPLNLTVDELLERFVKGDEARNSEGHGLGLSIAKSLMEIMDGTLELVIDGDLFKVVLKFRVLEKEPE